MDENEGNVARVIAALKKINSLEKLGDLFIHFGDNTKALNFYIKGQNFSKAISLAKKFSPDLIVKLQEKWGDQLIHDN